MSLLSLNSGNNKSRWQPFWQENRSEKPLPLILPQGDNGNIEETRIALEHAESIILRQEERIRQLEGMAMTDELTGIYNRRGFMSSIEREISFACRDKKASGALLMIDLDGLKSINDAFGHNAGDAYLKSAANALQSLIRTNDVVARLGGDEFAVILSRIDRKNGEIRAQEMARDFNCQVFEWENRAVPLRASFGMSLFSGLKPAEQIMAEADEKLYLQKEIRKNSQKAIALAHV